ncbi:MAG TPA: T9SS type A sorting domain-containing protein [Bacteroidota bacterium]|nr:T9SS type A sorting domain-containing protein [Bacteroidota bacterium]
MAKVDTGGVVTSVGEPQGNGFPLLPRLHQNYPNPFNSDTIIRYELPKREHVILKVFDLLGRQVTVIADGIESAGEHTVAFKANNLSSGVYLYRLITSHSAQTNKMLLLR